MSESWEAEVRRQYEERIGRLVAENAKLRARIAELKQRDRNAAKSIEAALVSDPRNTDWDC